MIILSVAAGLTNYMVNAQVADAAGRWTQEHIHSKVLFLLALNVFLILVGFVMDIFSAIVVVVPLILTLLRSTVTLKVSVMGLPSMVALSGSQSRVYSSFQWQTWSCTSPVDPTANQCTALRSAS